MTSVPVATAFPLDEERHEARVCYDEGLKLARAEARRGEERIQSQGLRVQRLPCCLTWAHPHDWERERPKEQSERRKALEPWAAVGLVVAAAAAAELQAVSVVRKDLNWSNQNPPAASA
jgi:hypothetical protein